MWHSVDVQQELGDDGMMSRFGLHGWVLGRKFFQLEPTFLKTTPAFCLVSQPRSTSALAVSLEAGVGLSQCYYRVIIAVLLSCTR